MSNSTLTEIAQRNRDQATANYRARRAEMNRRLGLGVDATPEQVHEALMKASSN